MRLKAYFTIEAAYIFAFITFLVIASIRLVYELHDRVVNDSCKIQAAIRMNQMGFFNYDLENKNINHVNIICSPIIGNDEKILNDMYRQLEKKIKKYFDEGVLSERPVIDISNIAEIIHIRKNADTIRAGGKVVELIGDIIDEN